MVPRNSTSWRSRKNGKPQFVITKENKGSAPATIFKLRANKTSLDLLRALEPARARKEPAIAARALSEFFKHHHIANLDRQTKRTLAMFCTVKDEQEFKYRERVLGIALTEDLDHLHLYGNILLHSDLPRPEDRLLTVAAADILSRNRESSPRMPVV